jgi:hypothetical protein
MGIGMFALALVLQAAGAVALEPEDWEKGREGFDLAAFPVSWEPAQVARLRALAADSGAPAYAGILAAADSALAVPPMPLETLVYEGHLPDHPRRLVTIEHLGDVSRLRVLGYAWLVGCDPRFADHAASIIRAWSGVYRPTGNPINENKLSSLIGIYAALRETHFVEEEREAVDAWLREIGARNRATGERADRMDNWQAKRLKVAAMVGSTVGDEALLGWARQEFGRYVAEGLYPDGSSEDFRHRDALTYHHGGLKPLLEIAQALDPGGDLYRREFGAGSSLAKSVAFLVRHVDGTAQHAEWVHTTSEIDRRRAAEGHARYQPGRIYQPWEALEALSLAAFFDPSLLELVTAIRRAAGFGTAPTWQQVVNAARAPGSR